MAASPHITLPQPGTEQEPSQVSFEVAQSFLMLWSGQPTYPELTIGLALLLDTVALDTFEGAVAALNIHEA